MATTKTTATTNARKSMATKLIAKRDEQAEYEDSHALESTVVMAFDTVRNSMGSFNNAAMIVRNKTELKVVESHLELQEAYAKLLA
jgi:hypothetical protein